MNPAKYLTAGLLALSVFCCGGNRAADALPKSPDELFKMDRVWTVHLKFTPEQWAAMQPKDAGAGFSAGLFIAPMLITLADGDNDGKLTREEFRGLGETWFAEWDRTKAGVVDADQLRAGLNLTFDPANPAGKAAAESFSADNFLLGAEGERNGLASAIGVRFEYVKAKLEFEDKVIDDIAVRYKGNGTWVMSHNSTKRSFKIDLNRFADGRRFAGQTQINLHNCVTDPSFMSEVLSHRLYRDAGVPAPRTSYARVYLTVPEKFDRQCLGLYSMVEDVGKGFLKEHLDTDKGALFKPVTSKLFAYRGDEWSRYQQAYDPKTDPSEAQKRRLIEFCRVVTDATDEQFAEKLRDYVEIDAFAKYLAVTASLSTLDSILGTGQNFYLYLHPKTDRLHFMPWDLDHSFGRADFMGSASQRENLSLDRPWVGENRFLERVMKVPAFREAYRKHVAEIASTCLTPERIQQQVDDLAKAIRPAIKEESSGKLKRFDDAVGGPRASRGFSLSRLAAAALPSGPKTIKAFVAVRYRSIEDQLAGRSAGEVVVNSAMRPGAPEVSSNPERKDDAGKPAPGLGAGTFFAPPLMFAVDADKDQRMTRDELLSAIDRWYETWKSADARVLTRENLRSGIDRTFTFPRAARVTTQPATKPATQAP